MIGDFKYTLILIRTYIKGGSQIYPDGISESNDIPPLYERMSPNDDTRHTDLGQTQRKHFEGLLRVSLPGLKAV